MPIVTGDIKLFASDTMDDTDQGGGAITGTEIVDGVSNNIFEDISTLDRVYGAVHMRKVFPAVTIQSQDKYFGSHVIISKLPGDTKIGVNLFNSSDWFDRRVAASSRVENYRAKGANYNGYLWATQYKDSRALSIFQSESATVPGVGDVLYLSQNGDSENQFVKIVSLTNEVQEFTDLNGTFNRRILTIEISQNLEYDFVGAQMTRYDTASPAATISTTLVANAAKYFSARPLAVGTAPGDLTVQADSVYSQLVPSSQTETPLATAQAGGDTVRHVESSAVPVSVLVGNTHFEGRTYYTGAPLARGKVEIGLSQIAGSGTGTLVDDGAGNFTLIGGSDGGYDFSIGDYSTGEIKVVSTGGNGQYPIVVSFVVASAISDVSETLAVPITAANRGINYVKTLIPAPAPGSVVIDYMALGEWYRLRDNGDGSATGDLENTGVASIDYATGAVTLTVAALPDVGSSILIGWGGDNHYDIRSGDVDIEQPIVAHTVPEGAVKPNSLTVSWLSNGASKSATDNGLGVLTGDATGGVSYSTGEIGLVPNAGSFPDANSAITYDYDYANVISETFTPNAVGGFIDISLASVAVTPGSVKISFPTTYAKETLRGFYWGSPFTSGIRTDEHKLNKATNTLTKSYRDDAAGGFATSLDAADSVNYANGDIHIKAEGGYSYAEYDERYSHHSWSGYESVSDNFVDGSTVTVSYMETSATPTTVQDVIAAPELVINLTPKITDNVIPGSVRFKLHNDVYIDRQGAIVRNVDPNTNAGTNSGSIDYDTGIVTLTDWDYFNGTCSIESLLTQFGEWTEYRSNFRTAGAPIRPESFYIQANKVSDGSLISGTADANGDISNSDLIAHIDVETGVVSAKFGRWVVAAGNEGEPWYDANELELDANGDPTGNVWQPEPVVPNTMTYNAVAYSFIPLNPEILGLDSVRLPQDGRVPIYDAGDVVVILHDQTTTGTYVNATQTDLGRTRLAKLSVKDSVGVEIDAAKYTADLDAGTIDWVDLSGVSQPLSIVDRIEDMALLTDVQINGQLTVSQPITHAFPQDETLISNAVIYGDLFAHTSIPFDQQTWNGTWSDVLQGNDVAAQYNNVTFPIQVDNASCIEERWYALFASSNTVHIIGENVGQILTSASILGDIAPINPNTAQPYFTIPAGGWGAGWSTGNVLRFNTSAANAPTWIIQSVGQGEATSTDYDFCLEVRGDIDTP